MRAVWASALAAGTAGLTGGLSPSCDTRRGHVSLSSGSPGRRGPGQGSPTARHRPCLPEGWGGSEPYGGGGWLPRGGDSHFSRYRVTGISLGQEGGLVGSLLFMEKIEEPPPRQAPGWERGQGQDAGVPPGAGPRCRAGALCSAGCCRAGCCFSLTVWRSAPLTKLSGAAHFKTFCGAPGAGLGSRPRASAGGSQVHTTALSSGALRPW